MAIVYLSLGSNSGDRIGYVQQATGLLGACEGITIVRTSAFYETEPWNLKDVTYDLHHSKFADNNVMTEYEEKFSSQGNPICKLIAARKN